MGAQKLGYSPLIILGMHRSGTTMLTKALEKMGVFVGDKKRHNYEATFFQTLNRWLLYQANTTWDYPEHYQYIDDVYFKQTQRVIAKRLETTAIREYLGNAKFLKCHSLFQLNFPWAWKDPVNSITWPVWLKLFPNAKFIHIYRNPFDVALSLQKREMQRAESFKIGRRRQLKERFLVQNFQYQQSYFVKQADNGVHLWKQYMQSIEKLKESLDQSQFIEFQYENLIENQELTFKQLSSFLELKLNAKEMHKIASAMHVDSKYKFKSSSKGKELYQNWKEDPMVQKYQYHNLIK